MPATMILSRGIGPLRLGWVSKAHFKITASVCPKRLLTATSILLGSASRPGDNKSTRGEGELVKPLPRLEVFNAAKKLQEGFQQGSATLNDAAECLFKARKHCELYTRNQAMTVCRELSLGARTLQWYQALYSSHARDTDPPFDFMHDLCWHLIAEGRGNLIWRWLRAICEEAVRTLPTEEAHNYPTCYKWSRHLLARYAEALITGVPSRHPDAAMRVFATFQTLTSPQSKFYRIVPYVAAVTLFLRHLKSDDCPPCDPKLFDEFRDRLVYQIGDDRAVVDQASLQLYHPLSPDATLFLKLISDGHPYLSERLFDRLRDQASRKFAHYNLRAAYILRSQGAEDEAQHLEDIVKGRCPVMWEQRSGQMSIFEKDPRFADLRRKPTA